MAAAVAVVNDQAENEPADEEHMGQRRQFINQVEADDNADGSNDRKDRAAEFPRNFRMVAAHSDDTDEVDQEYCQRTGVG